MLEKRIGCFLLVFEFLFGFRLHAELALALVVSEKTHVDGWQLGNKKSADLPFGENKIVVGIDEPVASFDGQQRGFLQSNSAHEYIAMRDTFFKSLSQENHVRAIDDKCISCTKFVAHYSLNLSNVDLFDKVKKIYELIVFDDNLFAFCLCDKNNKELRVYESPYQKAHGYYTILASRADNEHYFFSFGAGETSEEAVNDAELHLKEQYYSCPKLRNLLSFEWEFNKCWRPVDRGYRLPYGFVQFPTEFKFQ